MGRTPRELLLQHGDDLAALAAVIGRLGNGDPASIVGDGCGADVARRDRTLTGPSSCYAFAGWWAWS